MVRHFCTKYQGRSSIFLNQINCFRKKYEMLTRENNDNNFIEKVKEITFFEEKILSETRQFRAWLFYVL